MSDSLSVCLSIVLSFYFFLLKIKLSVEHMGRDAIIWRMSLTVDRVGVRLFQFGAICFKKIRFQRILKINLALKSQIRGLKLKSNSGPHFKEICSRWPKIGLVGHTITFTHITVKYDVLARCPNTIGGPHVRPLSMS